MKPNKILSEITNTPRKTQQINLESPVEHAYVTNDEDILDLRVEISDDDLFDNIKIDMRELKFIK